MMETLWNRQQLHCFILFTILFHNAYYCGGAKVLLHNRYIKSSQKLNQNYFHSITNTCSFLYFKL